MKLYDIDINNIVDIELGRYDWKDAALKLKEEVEDLWEMEEFLDNKIATHEKYADDAIDALDCQLTNIEGFINILAAENNLNRDDLIVLAAEIFDYNERAKNLMNDILE